MGHKVRIASLWMYETSQRIAEKHARFCTNLKGKKLIDEEYSC